MQFVISDWHLFHKNLREKVRSQFKSCEELAEHIVAQHNKAVTQHDTCYILGDIGNKEAIERYVPQMNGTKVLILGNHDTYSKEFYFEQFDYVYDNPLFVHKRILLSHIPQKVTPGVINIHGHTHLLDLTLEGYYNVCVERVNYTPVSMKKFRKELGKIAKPDYHFLKEWFADYQINLGEERGDLVFRKDGTIDSTASLKLKSNLPK